MRNINGLIKASTILYKHFGDLYDIPPFAYDDLMMDAKYKAAVTGDK